MACQGRSVSLAVNRTDSSILSLHYRYAKLYTLSPVPLCSQIVWTDLAAIHEGYQHLERARDAAFAVIRAVCSVSILPRLHSLQMEISRTLPFSMPLFRPLIGLALHTLVSIHVALPKSPIISSSYLTSFLRSTHEAIYTARPLSTIDPASPVTTRSPIAAAGPSARYDSLRAGWGTNKIG